METRRFDQLTVALARGGSRRSVLRSVAGGVLGALALDRSRALAKPEKGGGRPVTNPAKPICPPPGTTENCPLCYEARFGPKGDGVGGCCDPKGGEEDCANCSTANENCTVNGTQGSCVTASCKAVRKDRLRCEYTRQTGVCSGATGICCARFTHRNFGHCVESSADCQ